MKSDNNPNIIVSETLKFSWLPVRTGLKTLTIHSLGALLRANKRDTKDKNQAVGSAAILKTRLKILSCFMMLPLSKMLFSTFSTY